MSINYIYIYVNAHIPLYLVLNKEIILPLLYLSLCHNLLRWLFSIYFLSQSGILRIHQVYTSLILNHWKLILWNCLLSLQYPFVLLRLVTFHPVAFRFPILFTWHFFLYIVFMKFQLDPSTPAGCCFVCFSGLWSWCMKLFFRWIPFAFCLFFSLYSNLLAK